MSDKKQKTEQEEIDDIVDKYKADKNRKDVEVTYDENGNRYVHYKGEWIG